jgi:hypothetical protein
MARPYGVLESPPGNECRNTQDDRGHGGSHAGSDRRPIWALRSVPPDSAIASINAEKATREFFALSRMNRQWCQDSCQD